MLLLLQHHFIAVSEQLPASCCCISGMRIWFLNSVKSFPCGYEFCCRAKLYFDLLSLLVCKVVLAEKYYHRITFHVCKVLVSVSENCFMQT